MGYDMYTKEGDHYFRANIWGMELLRSIMADCGVEGGEMEERELAPDPETGEQQTLEGNLWSCFGSNDGWLVTPAECRYIAEKLVSNGYAANSAGYQRWDIRDGKTVNESTEYTEDDRQYARELAEFCEKAAELGGFYVW